MRASRIRLGSALRRAIIPMLLLSQVCAVSGADAFDQLVDLRPSRHLLIYPPLRLELSNRTSR